SPIVIRSRIWCGRAATSSASYYLAQSSGIWNIESCNTPERLSCSIKLEKLAARWLKSGRDRRAATDRRSRAAENEKYRSVACARPAHARDHREIRVAGDNQPGPKLWLRPPFPGTHAGAAKLYTDHESADPQRGVADR